MRLPPKVAQRLSARTGAVSTLAGASSAWLATTGSASNAISAVRTTIFRVRLGIDRCGDIEA